MVKFVSSFSFATFCLSVSFVRENNQNLIRRNILGFKECVFLKDGFLNDLNTWKEISCFK